MKLKTFYRLMPADMDEHTPFFTALFSALVMIPFFYMTGAYTTGLAPISDKFIQNQSHTCLLNNSSVFKDVDSNIVEQRIQSSGSRLNLQK